MDEIPISHPSARSTRLISPPLRLEREYNGNRQGHQYGQTEDGRPNRHPIDGHRDVVNNYIIHRSQSGASW
jgi:hypothetical protein